MAVARSSSGRVTKSKEEEAILVGCPGHSKALATFAATVGATFAAKRIIQSPITSCSRRDHSLCQASANRNPENSEHRSDGRISSGAKCDVYNLPCIHVVNSKYIYARVCDLIFTMVHIIMAALWNRAGHYIFMLWFLSSIYRFFLA